MIRRAKPSDMEDVFRIRRIVFIEGQNVPEAEEVDGKDDEAIHLIAFHEGAAIGTARLFLDGSAGKIGRVAVLDAVRGKGFGKALMHAAMKELKIEGVTTVKLAAQTHAIGFYEALGFEAYGPEFQDAGIPHRDMKRTL